MSRKSISPVLFHILRANKYRYGPPGKIRYTFSLVDWARRPEIQAAWVKIATEQGITADPFKDLERIWSPTHLALVTPWAMSVRYVLRDIAVICYLGLRLWHLEWIKQGKWVGTDTWTH